MRRDLLRMAQEWKKRMARMFRSDSSRDSKASEGSSFQRLRLARWWIIPVVVGVFGVFGCWQLFSTTHSASMVSIPILFDAPLPDPLRWRGLTSHHGLYFELKQDPRDRRLLARNPGPGTRAFRGQDVVPVFGEQSRYAEIFPASCKQQNLSEDTIFYTHDGLILWPCLDEQEEGKVSLYRMGWRFREKRWNQGLHLGRSASNDLVLGSALLPLRALKFSLQGGQLVVQSAEDHFHLPDAQRLVCLEPTQEDTVTQKERDAEITPLALNSPLLPSSTSPMDSSTTSSVSQESKASSTTDSQKTSTDSQKRSESWNAPKPSVCLHQPLRLVTGQRFRVFSKNHPDRFVTLLWKMSSQERGHYDLLLESPRSYGHSVRFWRTSPEHGHEVTYAVGNALYSFDKHLPEAVRTLDLDEQVHELVLRKILVYLPPTTLAEYLKQATHRRSLDLEQVAQQAPLVSFQSYLRPLYQNPYLRTRLWMANQALAQRYRQQAHSLFRIQHGVSDHADELVGLGYGGATLQAPQKNLLHWGTSERKVPVDLRLRTILTANQAGRSYLSVLDEKGEQTFQSIHFVGTEPLEVVQTSQLPGSWADRDWQAVSATTTTRTLLWVGDVLYRSRHILAYSGADATQTRATQPSDKPTRFLYSIRKSWTGFIPNRQRPKLQRRSDFWPIQELADRLGTLLTREKLTQALKELNHKAVRSQKHCGNESRRQGKRWIHGRGCWGQVEGFAKDTEIIVPCNDLVKTRVREEYCRPGQPSPQRDNAGDLIRPAIPSLEQASGVVILPYQNSSSIVVSTKTTGTSHSTSARHIIRLLSGSRPVALDGQWMEPNTNYLLRHGSRIELGSQKLRYSAPDGTLALAQFRREYIVPYYPEGPVFAHVISGSMGGPFRSSSHDLLKQIPQPTHTPIFPGSENNSQNGALQKNRPNAQRSQPSMLRKVRKIATSLQPDVQRIAFAVTRQHLARMDSPAFQKQFRRRYLLNPHKPHAGAVLVMDRSNGRLLASLSFPAIDPNIPQEQENESSQSLYRYLQGQIVDRFGITDGLIAYDPLKLPPIPIPGKNPEGRPSPIPHYLEAHRWAKKETSENIPVESRSGWLQERALSGAQTPGSTAKIITALAYARYLRAQGKEVRFPKHHCHGGLMFMRERKQQGTQSSWKPSTLRFRCHKREGHGSLNLEQALAVSCNVYFAKLALEMAGTPISWLRKTQVQWFSNRHGGSGKYQLLQIPSTTLSRAMKEKPIHRILFRTAADLGFAMRYHYRIPGNPSTSRSAARLKKQQRGQNRPQARTVEQYGRYTDVYWEPGQPTWPRVNPSLPVQEQFRHMWQEQQKRWTQHLPQGSFGLGRFFGYASAYPAWQQWVHGSHDPRYGYSSAVQKTFGSTYASLRAMAYLGFGQNLIVSPIQMALVAGAIAQGGWMNLPRFWVGDWIGGTPPSQQDVVSRPPPRQIAHVQDAQLIQQAMKAVTHNGTAARPFRQLNQTCLQNYGLTLIGKTGTAETSSQRTRERLRQRVRRAGRKYWHGGTRTSWIKQSGCHARKFWQYDEPEENIADSLFVGSFLSTPNAPSPLPSNPSNPSGWDVRNLAFAVVVKNGYHPEGASCVAIRNRRTADLDRTEAKYLAHDIILALLQSQGLCQQYQDPTSLLPLHPFKHLRTRKARKSPRKARKSPRKARKSPRKARKARKGTRKTRKSPRKARKTRKGTRKARKSPRKARKSPRKARKGTRKTRKSPRKTRKGTRKARTRT